MNTIIISLITAFVAGNIFGAFIYVQFEIFEQNKIIRNNDIALKEQQQHLKTLLEAKNTIIGEVGTDRRNNYESELLKTKEFEIKMVVYNFENKYNEQEINELFIKFAEDNDLYCGGSIKEITI